MSDDVRKALEAADRAACFADEGCECKCAAECKAPAGWHSTCNHAAAIAARERDAREKALREAADAADCECDARCPDELHCRNEPWGGCARKTARAILALIEEPKP